MKTTRRIVLGTIFAAAAQAALPPPPYFVWGAPNVAYTETKLGGANGFFHKGAISISPVGGKPTAITFTFIAESWQAKDYGRTLVRVVQKVGISVNELGILLVAPDNSVYNNSREFAVIPYFSKYVVTSVIHAVIVGSGTPNVTIRLSFQQIVDYQERHPQSGEYESIWTTRSTVPYIATATAIRNF
jgi:hypothetical protein